MFDLVIISYFVAYFLILGIYINEKYIRLSTKLYPVIGFLSFMAFLQVFSLIPLTIQMNSNLYFSIVFGITILSMLLILMLNHRLVKDEVIMMLKDSNVLTAIIISIITACILFLFSKSTGDAWLYLPQVLSSVQNTQIGYPLVWNGAPNYPHYFDSFYLFVSMTSWVSFSDPVNFIFESWIFLLAYLFGFSFTYVYEIIFGSRKKFLIITIFMAFISGMWFLSPYFFNEGIFFHLVYTIPSGTLFMYLLFIPLICIYFIKSHHNIPYLCIIILSGLAFSSSCMYLAITVCIISIIYIYFYKKNYVMFYDILITACIIIAYLFFQIAVFKDAEIFILIDLILLFCIFVFYKLNISIDIIKKVITFSTITFIIVMIVSYFLIGDSVSSQIDNLFNNEEIARIEFLKQPIVLIWLILGVYIAFVTDKRDFVIFSLIAVILFYNIPMYGTYGTIIGVEVYHRIMLTPLLFVFYCVVVDSIISKRFMIILFYFVMLCLFCLYTYKYELYAWMDVYFYSNPVSREETVVEYRMSNHQIYELLYYPFDEGDKIYTMVTPDDSRGTNSTVQLPKFITTISNTSDINEADYIIVPTTGCTNDWDYSKQVSYAEWYYDENKVYCTQIVEFDINGVAVYENEEFIMYKQ